MNYLARFIPVRNELHILACELLQQKFGQNPSSDFKRAENIFMNFHK